MEDNKKYILKTLVGSHAHGLATPESDYDYRGVYVIPTKEILSLNFTYKGSHWLEGEQDQTAYEIGHFLQLATRCNPSILEVMVAPVIPITEESAYYTKFENINSEFIKLSVSWGNELRALLPYCWSPKQAFDAFTGYSHNQQKKMLDNHLGRWQKYGTAYLRVLWNLCNLLETGTFSLEVKDPVFKRYLQLIRNKEYTVGQIIDLAKELRKKAELLLPLSNQKSDLSKVNNFLLKIRKEFWND
jgi:predicted nucleotidyltransferase